MKNSTYDKGDGGANTTVVLNACGASSRLRRGFPSSSHGYYHGSPQGVASRVRKVATEYQWAGASESGSSDFLLTGRGIAPHLFNRFTHVKDDISAAEICGKVEKKSP